MDMPEFQRVEEEEEDHNIEDFFPKIIPYPLQPLIEYRIKLLLKNDTIFLPGESQVVNTTCMMKGKSRQRLSMFLNPYENLPLGFESGGYICRKYSGRVVIKLTNYSKQTIRLNNGTVIGYIIMQPFSLE